MSDNRIRCALAFRLKGKGPVCIAKYDYACQIESHREETADLAALYGRREHSFVDAITKVIENDPPEGDVGKIGGFKVVQSEQHQVVYAADTEGICFAVVMGRSYTARVTFEMLQELYADFTNKVGKRRKGATGKDDAKVTKTLLKEACEKYSDPCQVDNVSLVRSKIEAVALAMQDNIAKILINIDDLEKLSEKCDDLSKQALVFKKRSGDLKNHMAWKNVKMSFIFTGVLIVILFIIIGPFIVK